MCRSNTDTTDYNQQFNDDVGREEGQEPVLATVVEQYIGLIHGVPAPQLLLLLHVCRRPSVGDIPVAFTCLSVSARYPFDFFSQICQADTDLKR
jgi:hypothetical protein